MFCGKEASPISSTLFSFLDSEPRDWLFVPQHCSQRCCGSRSIVGRINLVSFENEKVSRA